MAGLLYTCVTAALEIVIIAPLIIALLTYAVAKPQSASYNKETLQNQYSQYAPREDPTQDPPKPPLQVIEAVRNHMRRQLTAKQRRLYRLFTLDGTLHPKYDILYNIATIEELIKAELNGELLRPSDAPGKMFLFSKGKGLVATCFEGSQDKIPESDEPVLEATMSELNVKYKTMAMDQPPDPNDMPSILDQVAVTFLHWRARRAGLLYYEKVNCISSEELYSYH